MAQGMVPSSMCVSDTRVALIKHLSQFFDLHVDRYGWRYTKLKSMLVPLLKHWRAHEKFGNEPMDLKAWIDGAPTMKLKSRVAFLLHFIDPRLHPGINTFPQSRDWHHLVAEYFGSEDAASLRSNFEALIEELRQLGEHGLTYELDDGSSVTVLFDVIHCPDMKARWALAKRCEVAPDSDDEEGLAEEEHGSLPESRPVGGGITQSTWPCDLGPLHESNRARGPGGGCRACRAERAAAGTPCLPGRLVASESDLHFWVDQPAADGFKLRACMHCDPFDESDGRREFAAERDARLARMTTESANPNLPPLHRVPPLLANKAAHVREVHARLPHLAVTVLEKKKVDELNAMMGAHCQGLVMASDERLPGDVVASLDAAAVVKQLELHNVRHDANDDASCRAMLEQRLVDVIVLRQVQFALEWPGIPSTALLSGCFQVGDLLHLEVGPGQSRENDEIERWVSRAHRRDARVTRARHACVTSAPR